MDFERLGAKCDNVKKKKNYRELPSLMSRMYLEKSLAREVRQKRDISERGRPFYLQHGRWVTLCNLSGVILHKK